MVSQSGSAQSFVAFVGSRSWASSSAGLAPLLLSVVSSGWGVGLGCCVGADALLLSVLAGAPALAARAQVFCAFGPLGVGALPSLSCVGGVSAAAAAGAAVHWWSGGSPAVPVRARLASRTRHMVSSPHCAGVVAFLSGASVGSLSACRLAASRGLPVVAFVSGLAVPPVLFPGAGSWRQLRGGRAWSFGWQWVPSAGSLFPAPPAPWLRSGFQSGS